MYFPVALGAVGVAVFSDLRSVPAERYGATVSLKLPPLPYPASTLQPAVSESTVLTHHDVHEAGYVSKANTALQRLQHVRQVQYPDDARVPMRVSIGQYLAFATAGIVLHELYWKSFTSPDRTGLPGRSTAMRARRDFGSVQGMLDELADAAKGLLGSGWSLLLWSPTLQRLVVAPVERHDLYLEPGAVPVLALDVWEHAYYLDWGPDRAGYVDALLRQVDWRSLESRLQGMLGHV